MKTNKQFRKKLVKVTTGRMAADMGRTARGYSGKLVGDYVTYERYLADFAAAAKQRRALRRLEQVQLTVMQHGREAVHELLVDLQRDQIAVTPEAAQKICGLLHMRPDIRPLTHAAFIKGIVASPETLKMRMGDTDGDFVPVEMVFEDRK